MDKEFRRSIRTTLAILVAFTMVLATFALGVILTDKTSSAIRKLTSDYMLSVTNTAAAMIDGDDLRALDYGCEGTDGYANILSTLTSFNDNIRLEDIYCLKQNSMGEFIFVMDLTSDHPAKFGDPVGQVTEAMRKATLGVSAVDDKPYEDAWGRFYSSYSPVFDSEGNVAGIVSVDFDAQWYDEQIRSISETAFYVGAMSLIIGAVVVVIMTARTRNSLKRAHAKLNDLSENVEELIVGIGNLTRADLNREPNNKVKMVYEDDGLEALGEKIENMQGMLHDQISLMQENAYVDGMTGARNRNSYLEDVELADPSIKDGTLGFSVAVFDITGLKTINDTQGHECGDRAIIDTAKVLTEVFGRDNTYRVGGDEFVAAVRYATASDMKKSFEKIDALLEKVNEKGGQYETMPLILSKGYAEFDPNTDSEFMDAFNRADRMMYEDKAAYYKKHDRRSRS